MKLFKKNWLKIILIIFSCVLLDGILHLIMSPITSSSAASSLHTPSIFVKKGLLIPAVFVYASIVYGILAIIFEFIQDKLPGSKLSKGFLFGLSFGTLYFIGMFEGYLLMNDTLLNDFLTGVADFFPLLLMGTLLGIFTGTEKNKIVERKYSNVLSLFIITVFFIIGRYFSYSILHITSAYSAKPLATFIWTLCQGLSVGIIYFNLHSGIKGKTFISKGLFFGIIVFGLNWLMYHLFIALIYEVSFTDIFIRVGIDTLFSIFAAALCSKIFAK